ncbi:hypothetical protein HELRODRAFT_89038 [Helobdella robusta]|uniref:tRNA (cytosine(38)-C(5))-methyltransferase n=1 Tax=Helobdella robusta TaxID=6412 RepID=T1G782_HELRO|nr:hypothetical protein HELRODRAFT_89038 [Helobdella robusta]ESN93362.1 hypothetical protein HELRODRAFT_89038 [Helobdella robusta]
MVLKVLELYSGIGGMHFALNESGIKHEVVAAIDINPVCNAVYRHNFPNTKLIEKCLTSIFLKDFNKMSADMILMSPPCQPFTTIGKQKDVHDERTKSFQYFLSILPKFSKLPGYILMENVKGIESSIMRGEFLKVLSQLNYDYQEFILDPTQFGIPNSRRRYYLLAKLQNVNSSLQTRPDITYSLLRQNDNSTTNISQTDDKSVLRPLRDFLEKQLPEYFEKFRLPKKLYKKYWLMDLVSENSKSCCCFTKGYGRYVEKAGSIFQTSPSEVDLFPYKNHESDEQFVAEVDKLGLRFFTPREIANFLCFPSTFEFPANLNIQQQYRVLGNSLNVHVVSMLLKLLCS